MRNMTKQAKRVNIITAVNAANVSKSGGTYTVKDVVHAIDGIVLNSRLYTGDELVKSVEGLNGRPAPAGHPKDSKGRHISATNGEALSAAWIGAFCTNSRYEGGRAVCDITINEAQAKALPTGAKVIERLDAAISGTNTDPIGVSSGLLLQEVAANGESRGKKYSSIATNMQFDHLAILLNEQPAGTPEEGIGMFVNADGEEDRIDCAVLDTNDVDTAKAEKSLKDAISLHEKHMKGTAPTTGPDGEKSQMKMMRMMKAALDYLTGKDDGAEKDSENSKNKTKASGMGGMKMNADLAGWIGKLLGNEGTLSFEQITDGLRAVLPKDCYPREVFSRYVVWMDYANDKLYRQDYSVASDGSVALTGQPVEVRREVTYEPVSNHVERADAVKDKILAALNAAGIKTEGLDEAQILTAYNALVVKPVQEQVEAANSKIAEFETAATAAQNAERDALATELAVNSSLTVEDLKLLPLERLKELKTNAKAAPVIVGKTGEDKKSEFTGYSINSHLEAK